MAPGAVNVPMSSIQESLKQFGDDKSRPVIFYCAKGIRAANAAAFLKQFGFSNTFSTVDAQTVVSLLDKAKAK